MTQENLPLSVPGDIVGGSSKTILAQFYRFIPIPSNNILLPIVNSASRVFLPLGTYNNTQASDDTTFPDLNSIQIAKSGTYLHTITIYMSSDVSGVIAVDLVNAMNMVYNLSAFAIKNTSTTNTAPVILQAMIAHNSNDLIKLRFGGASFGNLGIVANIWSIQWSIKS
jgi:hypothetical protein